MKPFKYMFLIDIPERKYTQVSYWTRCVSFVVVNYSYRGDYYGNFSCRVGILPKIMIHSMDFHIPPRIHVFIIRIFV